jgi:uncharacterized protein
MEKSQPASTNIIFHGTASAILHVNIFLVVIYLCITACSSKSGKNQELPLSPNARMQEIYWADVKWTNGFWADKFELCRKEIIPAVYNGFMSHENTEHLDNLKVAAGLKEGKFEGLNWSDGDCYKWIESMAFMYGVTKDAKLDSAMDEWINVIARAQEPDGYISTNMQLEKHERYIKKDKPHPGAYHEMYNMGHLMTAACIHYHATGKENFLKIAIKVADHLVKVFHNGAPELRMMTGNMPNIMGLVDMYRITGDKRYLTAARIPVNIRGHMPDTTDFTQDHVPFLEETEAVGHSVFATYLYSGIADIVAESGEKELWNALDRIWHNATERRTYITGGVCAIPNGKSARGDVVVEAFGADYELPNRTAYNETCANIGNAMWNWRMLLLTGDAKYTDIVETVIYNTMLSAVSADGRKFFYANPLKWDFNTQGHTHNFSAERWSTFMCYCCPPSVSRTIAGLGRWAYSVTNDTIWVHLYGGNTLKTRLPNGSAFALEQESQYPWNGEIRIIIKEAQEKSMSVMLRIPGWVEGPSLKINNQNFEGSLEPGSYVAINRKWKKGDVIDMNLPMPVRLMEANPKVEDDRNCVAVMRGPLVYCAEFPKSENGEKIWKDGIYLSENIVLSPKTEKEMFGGVVVLKGKAFTSKDRDKLIKKNKPGISLPESPVWDGQLYRRLVPQILITSEAGSMDITLIPYFAWANRGPSYMTVWIPVAK